MSTQSQRIVERIILAFCLFIIAGYVVFFAQKIFHSSDLLDASGRPVGSDFTVFWAVSRLSLDGSLSSSYEIKSLMAALQDAVPTMIWGGGFYIWAYPPTYSLFNWPLALLGYVPSLVIWTAITFALFLTTGSAIHRHKMTPWLVAAFPAVFICIGAGQNGLLTASIIGFGCLLLPRRPVLAGIIFGLLSVKPQIALLLPFALIFGRQWRAFSSAAVTSVVLVVVSTLVFGVDSWLKFFESMPAMTSAMQARSAALDMMPSLYPTLLAIGLPAWVSITIHGAVAIVVGYFTCLAWWRTGPSRENIAMMIAGGAVVAPYIFGYDMTIIGIALLFLIRDVRELTRVERYFLMLAWFSPILNPVFAELIDFQLGWIILLILVFWCWRRGQERSDNSVQMNV